jgi:hypothetical protein
MERGEVMDDVKTWGVLNFRGQRMVWRVTEKEARACFDTEQETADTLVKIVGAGDEYERVIAR